MFIIYFWSLSQFDTKYTRCHVWIISHQTKPSKNSYIRHISSDPSKQSSSPSHTHSNRMQRLFLHWNWYSSHCTTSKWIHRHTEHRNHIIFGLAAAVSACADQQFGSNFHRICEAQTLGNSLNVGLSVRTAGGASDRHCPKARLINGLSYLLIFTVVHKNVACSRHLTVSRANLI